MISSSRILTIVVAAMLCISQSVAVACEYNVRDVGFVDLKTMPYRLYIYVNDSIADDLKTSLDDALFMELLDSNIDVTMLNVDSDAGKPGMHLLKGITLNAYPSAIMVSPKGYSHRMVLTDGNFESQLDALTQSPLRETLLEQVTNHYGVVLVIEGPDADENESVRDAATRSVRKIHTRMKMLPKAIANPPVVQVVTRDQYEDEKLLLWSLGVDPATADSAHAVILYGRGRQMGPVLKGEAITEERLSSYLTVIGADCECGLDRSWMQGTMIPLKWTDEIQERVSASLGFDPENPRTKMEISMTVAKGQKNRLNSGSDTKNPDAAVSSKMSFAYSESVVEFDSRDQNILDDNSVQLAALDDSLFDGDASRAPVDKLILAQAATDALDPAEGKSLYGDVFAATDSINADAPTGRILITIAVLLVVAISGAIVIRAARS
ncbi:MAG: hypothetical protein VCD00_16965 [Candidatus Hydrogenedentota bacterium]